MTSVFIQTSKYLMIALLIVYVLETYLLHFRHYGEKARRYLLSGQTILMILVLSLGFLSMTAYTGDLGILIRFFATIGLILLIQIVYRKVYLYGSIMLCNHMCILLGIGLMILTRLDPEKTIKQIMIAGVSLFVTAFVPYLMSKRKNRFRKLKWAYLAIGVALLLSVVVIGTVSNGAKLSISLGPVSIQPSEFVKLSFVFFIAAMYHESKKMKQVLITTGFAALHVLLLVAAKDLGSALILFVIYVVMSYDALRKWYILPVSFLVVVLAMLVAGKVMTHVSNRIIAWLDPLSTIDNQGYQVSQSLFAIGTGGWVGSGLFQGRSKSIPVVTKDFIFSAIAEELGTIVAIALILICLSVVLLFFKIAGEQKDEFYHYVAVGFGVSYGFQVFLTIGGCIKLIPSTGVTLPLVSYGGSSLFATFLMFSIVESLFMTSKKRDSR